MRNQGSFRVSRRSLLLGMLAAGCGMLKLRLPEAAAYQPFEPFSFAFVSDVHLANGMPDSYKLVHESQLFLQELIKELNEHNLNFVIFGGDQVEEVGRDQANWQLFLDCLQGLNSPWSFTLGEADVSGDVPPDKMRIFGPDWKGRGIETETPFWSHTLDQLPSVHLIGLDTSLANSTIGMLSHRQLDWLKQDLLSAKRLFTIVFCHHPLLPPPPFDGGPPFDEYVIPDGAAAREILATAPNVRLVISGHVHVSKVQQEKDIWHISCPSLAVYPCAYHIFHVTPDAVTMETHQIGFPALIKKARKALSESNLARKYNASNPESFVALVQGVREDRDALIPLVSGKPIQALAQKKKKQRKAKDKEPDKDKESDKGKQAESQGKEGRSLKAFKRRRSFGKGGGEPDNESGEKSGKQGGGGNDQDKENKVFRQDQTSAAGSPRQGSQLKESGKEDSCQP